MNRRYPQRPLIGVAGVVFDGESVLLVRRGRSPAKGQWSIPGGLVELGENVEKAVSRELEEETGLKVEPERLIEVVERVEKDDLGRVVYHYVILDFLCRRLDGRPNPGSDADETRWVSLGELPGLDLPGSTLRVIRKARAMRDEDRPA